MAIVRFANEILNDADTMTAFFEAFPNAKEIKLPEGAQTYKLFNAAGKLPNGDVIPDNDDIIVLYFQRNGSKTKIDRYEKVWYNNVAGKKVFKTLKDLTNA